MQLGRVMQQQSIGVDVGQGELAAHSNNVMVPFQLALPIAFSEIFTRFKGVNPNVAHYVAMAFQLLNVIILGRLLPKTIGMVRRSPY